MKGPLSAPIQFIALLIVAASMAISGPPLAAKEKAKPKESRMKDLADTVATNRIMTKFALLLRASGQDSFLSSMGPLTLFVPTNSAFSRVPPDAYAALLRPENRDTLQRIILFHIVNGKRLSAKDLAPLKTLLSCEGSPLPLRVNRAGYQIVSKAKILRADTRCLNGLLHEIDTVLLPPGVSLSALASAPPAPAVNDMANPAPPTNDISVVNPEPAVTNADTPTNAPAVTPVQ